MKFCFRLLSTTLLFFTELHAAQFCYPVGAQQGAMGGASVMFSDVWSAFNNQAGLAYIKTISAGANYENRFLLPELSLRSLALVLPFKGTTFGLSASSFGYRLYSENKYGLAIAKTFSDKISAGIQLDYLNLHIAESYANKNVMTAEIGMLAKPLKNLIISAHVFNPVRSKLYEYNNERVSTIMKMGASYTFSEKVMLVAEVNKTNTNPVQFRTGIEYKIVKEFFIRTGIGTNPSNISFGIGLILNYFSIDIASTYNQVLGYTPQLSIIYVVKRK